MDEEYDLCSILIDKKFLCYELVKADSSSSELERWQNDPKKKDVVDALYKVIERIKKYGIAVSVQTSKLTPISSKERLYEIKNYSGVNREMSWIALEGLDNEPVIVLLFGFVGHQGPNGKIPEEKRDKGLRLSQIALNLLRAKGIIK